MIKIKPYIFSIIILISLTLSLLADESVKHFKTYNDIFIFISQQLDLPDNTLDSINKLAADSVIEKIDGIINETKIIIITTNYYENGNNFIRGASNNGDFFIFQWEKDYYKFIGHIQGSGYKTKRISKNGKDVIHFITSWHMSTGERNEHINEWDGISFINNGTRKITEDGKGGISYETIKKE